MKKPKPRQNTTTATASDMMPRQHHEIVMDFCLYFLTECLKNDTHAEIEADDPQPLRDMKTSINDFVDRHRKRIFGYENFIETKTDMSVEDARSHVAYVIDVIQRGNDKSLNQKHK